MLVLAVCVVVRFVGWFECRWLVLAGVRRGEGADNAGAAVPADAARSAAHQARPPRLPGHHQPAAGRARCQGARRADRHADTVSGRVAAAARFLLSVFVCEVAVRRAGLVLGWVTVFGRANHLGVLPATRANSASYPQRDGK